MRLLLTQKNKIISKSLQRYKRAFAFAFSFLYLIFENTCAFAQEKTDVNSAWVTIAKEREIQNANKRIQLSPPAKKQPRSTAANSRHSSIDTTTKTSTQSALHPSSSANLSAQNQTAGHLTNPKDLFFDIPIKETDSLTNTPAPEKRSTARIQLKRPPAKTSRNTTTKQTLETIKNGTSAQTPQPRRKPSYTNHAISPLTQSDPYYIKPPRAKPKFTAQNFYRSGQTMAAIPPIPVDREDLSSAPSTLVSATALNPKPSKKSTLDPKPLPLSAQKSTQNKQTAPIGFIDITEGFKQNEQKAKEENTKKTPLTFKLKEQPQKQTNSSPIRTVKISLDFQSDEPTLSQEHKTFIQEHIASLLKQQPHKTLTMNSYAQGSNAQKSHTRRKSLKRALRIKNLLITQGISTERIFIKALGNSQDTISTDHIDFTIE